jgi:hypothetical protein
LNLQQVYSQQKANRDYQGKDWARRKDDLMKQEQVIYIRDQLPLIPSVISNFFFYSFLPPHQKFIYSASAPYHREILFAACFEANHAHF